MRWGCALGRIAGGRDIALGLLALAARDDSKALRIAALAGAAVDAADAVTFGVAARDPMRAAPGRRPRRSPSGVAARWPAPGGPLARRTAGSPQNAAATDGARVTSECRQAAYLEALRHRGLELQSLPFELKPAGSALNSCESMTRSIRPYSTASGGWKNLSRSMSSWICSRD